MPSASRELPLGHVLRHNTWATLELVRFLSTLDPARRDVAAPGTYGSAYETLRHLVGAEQWYVQLLTGEILGTRMPRGSRPSLDEIGRTAALLGERVVAVADEDDATRPIAMNEGRRSTVGVVLAQLVHHGNEHRTQVTTILGANGIEPPPVSAWGYGRAVGISSTEE